MDLTTPWSFYVSEMTFQMTFLTYRYTVVYLYLLFYISTIVSGDGTLLSGGSNIYGQLGRSSTQDLELLPVDISVHPVSISSGLGHSLAICQIPSSEGGEGISGVFSWGWGQNRQLGREGPGNIPLLVDGLLGEKPVVVSGGRVHSIALTDNGEVFAWGCGRNGRLGLGSSVDEPEPIVVEFDEDVNVLQVASGFDHNLVLTS